MSQTAASQLWPHQQTGRSLDLVADQAASAEFRRNQTAAVVGIVGDEPSPWIANGDSKAIVYSLLIRWLQGQSWQSCFWVCVATPNPSCTGWDADLTASNPNALEEIDALQIRGWVIEDAYTLDVVYWVAIALGSLALLLTLVFRAAHDRSKPHGTETCVPQPRVSDYTSGKAVPDLVARRIEDAVWDIVHVYETLAPIREFSKGREDRGHHSGKRVGGSGGLVAAD